MSKLSATSSIDLAGVLAPSAHVVAAGAGARAPHPTRTDEGAAEHAEIASWYEQAFAVANAGGTPVYGAWPPLTEAAHARKMGLLDALPLGDLRDAVIVDYGVGDRGFAGVVPRLRDCRLAIGIDISEHAARESARISADAGEGYADRWAYLTARGTAIDVRDGAADVVLAGEVIEHVDHTEAWLDEVHRVLKPGGLVIVTTPNADAALYRGRGEQWCVSPEHVALMGYAELRRRLAPRFELLAEKGFNMSFHESLDNAVQDPEFAAIWAARFEDRPDLATGVVVLGRRRDDYAAPRRSIAHLSHDDPRLRYNGAWTPVSLERNLTGRAAGPGGTVALDFEGTESIVQFWVDAWSGVASVEIDGVPNRVDLYSPHAGFRRLCVDGISDGPHRLLIVSTRERRPGAQDARVILHHILTGRAKD